MVAHKAQPDVQSLTVRENLLSPEELAHTLEVAETTLADWRSQKKGPPYAKIGRNIWYPRDRVERWIKSQVRETSNVGDESRREMAFPISVGRQAVRRNNRLGRHQTKHE